MLNIPQITKTSQRQGQSFKNSPREMINGRYSHSVAALCQPAHVFLFVCLFFAAFGSSKTEQDAQASLPITSMYALSPPLSKSPTTVVHLLQSVNLH